MAEKFIYQLPKAAVVNDTDLLLLSQNQTSYYITVSQLPGATPISWPLAMPLVDVDPEPLAGNVLFYALTNGGVSPNNLITIKLLLPNGAPIVLAEMTV
jgi:hypothetical protein